MNRRKLFKNLVKASAGISVLPFLPITPNEVGLNIPIITPKIYPSNIGFTQPGNITGRWSSFQIIGMSRGVSKSGIIPKLLIEDILKNQKKVKILLNHEIKPPNL